MERVTATPALLFALLIAVAFNAADRTVLSSQIASLEAERDSQIASIEAERDSLHSRVELVEQAFTALLAQSSVAAAALPARRGLQEATATSDRATVRVDAPDGISEIILGGEAAADNVVLSKAHERDGVHFTLSRNDTQVLRVDPAGNVTVLTDPLQVSGTLKVGGSLEVGGVQVSGPDFAQEVRLFLGGVCPPGWIEAIETTGKLLASRGGSEVAGSSKNKAGISATVMDVPAVTGATLMQAAVMDVPDSFAILLCKRWDVHPSPPPAAPPSPPPPPPAPPCTCATGFFGSQNCVPAGCNPYG